MSSDTGRDIIINSKLSIHTIGMNAVLVCILWLKKGTQIISEYNKIFIKPLQFFLERRESVVQVDRDSD